MSMPRNFWTRNSPILPASMIWWRQRPRLAIATQVYTAARLAADPDQPAEQRFLARLAAGLKLQPELVSNIDAAARSAPQW